MHANNNNVLGLIRSWEPNRAFLSILSALTSTDSPGGPCWKVAPERITGSKVSPPALSSAIDFVLIHIFYWFAVIVSALHIRKELQGGLPRRNFGKEESLDGAKTYRGGAGKRGGRSEKQQGRLLLLMRRERPKKTFSYSNKLNTCTRQLISSPVLQLLFVFKTLF